MNQIAYDGAGELYISDISDAREGETNHLDRVITVCQDSIEDNISDSMTYSFHCMADGPFCGYGGYHSYYMFEQAANELHDALAADESVLIHCHQGASRSVAVSAAALGRLLNINRYDALALIHRYRIVGHMPDGLLIQHVDTYLEQHEIENFI